MSLFRALLIAPYHSLALISDRIKADYPDLDLTIHEGDLHRGLEAALGSFETDYDVVISRGGTAQMLEDEISIPVIEIAVSGSDLLRGLAAHNPLGKRCAVIGFSNTLESVAEVADFSDFDLDVFEVAFEDELPLVLQEIFEEKYEVVLCDNFAVQKCRELGINAHLLESGEQSVRAAFKRAAFLCQQTSEIQKKSHLLWDLLKSLPSAFALFSASGKLVYTNLPEARNDLLPFMREHLDDPAPAKLTLQRAGKVHRISLSHIGAEGEEIIAFNVSSSPAPAGERLVGLRRQNRDEVEQRYRESVFKATGGGEAAAPLVARLAKTNKPIMLEGEIGVGKAQIVYLIYLSGTRSNHPLVIIDCSLLVDKSWDYLMNSTGSPLYGSGQTIYFKAAHALEGDRLRYLLDVLVRSGTAQRSQLIFSANDDSQGTEAAGVAQIVETMNCLVFHAPPLRKRDDLASAISLFLISETAKTGDPTPMVTDEAMDSLCKHQWPQNYIELRQVLQRALFESTGAPITAAIVNKALDRESSRRFSTLSTPDEATSIELLRPLKETEQDIVRMVVEKYGGNQTEAARILGLSRTTIWRILKDA